MFATLSDVIPRRDTVSEKAFLEAVTRDDRRGLDRRRRPTPMLSRWALFGGRRRGARRAGERANEFVDVHGTGMFLVVTAILMLNYLDAWFTMYFLSHGGTELNPLVDAVIGMGVMPFIFLKSLGIGFCVLVLTMTKNFAVARFGMGVILVGYTALLGWHLYLLGSVPQLAH